MRDDERKAARSVGRASRPRALMGPSTHYSATVDLSSYCGYFLDSITVAAAPDGTAAIAMMPGPGDHGENYHIK